jgi:hypothetical protein
MTIGLDVINQLTGGRLGKHDVPCPECGPFKRAVRNQRRPVLRVYRIEDGFAGYHCARCGESGAAADAAERDRALRAERLSKANWLWCQRRPIAGSVAETYLREARGYGGPLPATLGFLPARGDHPPAMIAAFGLTREVEPGVIVIANKAVSGVHLTRLRPDGSGKATFEDPDESAKLMIGYSAGSPIVLAAPNDLLGLVITEGIEDALSAHEATGLGAWAAGSASRMPALADSLPHYIEVCTVAVDDDPDGRRHAAELGSRMRSRGIETNLIVPNTSRFAA